MFKSKNQIFNFLITFKYFSKSNRNTFLSSTVYTYVYRLLSCNKVSAMEEHNQTKGVEKT